MLVRFLQVGIFSSLIAFSTAMGATRYVVPGSTGAVSPFLSWSTAAFNIQDAIDAADPGDLILVTNGVYEVGGRAVAGKLTNRVAVTKAVTVCSVNGPLFTTIRGHQVNGTTNGVEAARCVYLAKGAVLAGFTLTGGATLAEGDWKSDTSGGAVWSEDRTAVISNCWLMANSAQQSAGGAYSGYLVNSLITGNNAYIGGGGVSCTASNSVFTGNTARGYGGATDNAWLLNCVLSGNSASFGGGANGPGNYTHCLIVSNQAAFHAGGLRGGTARNSTIAFNSAFQGGGAMSSSLFNSIIYYNSASHAEPETSGCFTYFCCTLPPSAANGRNITNEPGFMDAAAGDFRLRRDSPCINSGKNSMAAGDLDLDFQPRIAGGTVDLGALEFPNPTSTIAYAWLQQHGLPLDGTEDFSDMDLDGATNLFEWLAGTDPLNPLSILQVVSVSKVSSGINVEWTSVQNRSYWIERSTNLLTHPQFSTVKGYIPGLPGTTIYTDTNVVVDRPVFYRVRSE